MARRTRSSSSLLGTRRAFTPRSAGKLGVDVTDSVISAHVGIGQVDGGFKLEVTLDAKLPNASLEDAKKAVEAAHQVCPYSNATRGNIEVTLNVIE